MLTFATPLASIQAFSRSNFTGSPVCSSAPRTAGVSPPRVTTMTLWNLGSINVDNIYAVPHIPSPGETLAATDRQVFLGGKGANLSVASARALASVKHIGAVGADGKWTIERLSEWGVDTRFIATLDVETGHAIIAVDSASENAIILRPGANAEIPEAVLEGALSEASAGDWFITQNETSLQSTGVRLARKMGLKVGYAAAPFDEAAVSSVLGDLDFLILNAVEAEQLEQATGQSPSELGVKDVIVTLGSGGADWYGSQGNIHFDADKVHAVDSTGAGDTFTGYVLAGLDRGLAMEDAVPLALKAGALMVTRRGTANVIPDMAEVVAFKP